MFAKKVIRWIVWSGVILCCFFVVCYRIPKNIRFEGEAIPYNVNENYVISDESNTHIEVEIKEWNYFFRPSKTTGCIYFMENTYQDIYSIGGDVFKYKNIFEKLKLKFEGVRYDFFVDSQAVELGLSMDKWYEDTIWILNYCDDELKFAHRNKDTGITTLYTVSNDRKEKK